MTERLIDDYEPIQKCHDMKSTSKAPVKDLERGSPLQSPSCYSPMSVETEEVQQQSSAPIRNRQSFKQLPDVDYMTSYNEESLNENDTSYTTSQSSMIREGGGIEKDDDSFDRRSNRKSVQSN